MAHQDHFARTIAEDILFRTGEAVMSGDTASFVACFALPHIFETAQGSTRVETADHLVQMFETVRHGHALRGVTDLARHIVQATFHDDKTIHSTHESRLLRGTTLLEDPFPVFSVIRAFGPRWLISSSTYGARHDSHVGRTLEAARFVN